MTVISYYSIAIRFVLGDAYHSLSKEERRNLLHVIRKRIIVILFSKIKHVQYIGKRWSCYYFCFC